MKVYHGSLHHIHNANVEKGRPSTDFGKGFYTTTNLEQAKRWALNKLRLTKYQKAFVNIYEVDDNLLNNQKYSIKKFDSPNEEWLNFVVNCRMSVPHNYDLVFSQARVR